MIRLVWVALNLFLATFFFGVIAIGASLLRIRGRIYVWCTREWSRAALWASGTPVLTEGMEAIDWSRPHVLVSNHISGYDIFAIASVLPVPFHFVGKKELNRIPLFGTAWRAAGHISIDRSNRATAIASLERAAERIRRDSGIVIIFPEGTRSRTGELRPFKKGAFLMALQAGIPVLPAVVRGSDGIHPAGSFRIRPRPIRVKFGVPIPTAGRTAAEVDPLIEEVRARMMEMMARE